MRIHIEQLAKKLAAGYSDKDIMQELNLPERTFYYRKAQISKIYGNIARKKTEGTAATARLNFSLSANERKRAVLVCHIKKYTSKKTKNKNQTAGIVVLIQ
jgi:hypothetical protein